MCLRAFSATHGPWENFCFLCPVWRHCPVLPAQLLSLFSGYRRGRAGLLSKSQDVPEPCFVDLPRSGTRSAVSLCSSPWKHLSPRRLRRWQPNIISKANYPRKGNIYSITWSELHKRKSSWMLKRFHNILKNCSSEKQIWKTFSCKIKALHCQHADSLSVLLLMVVYCQWH